MRKQTNTQIKQVLMCALTKISRNVLRSPSSPQGLRGLALTCIDGAKCLFTRAKLAVIGDLQLHVAHCLCHDVWMKFLRTSLLADRWLRRGRRGRRNSREPEKRVMESGQGVRKLPHQPFAPDHSPLLPPTPDTPPPQPRLQK
jgi:hypothetical protein